MTESVRDQPAEAVARSTSAPNVNGASGAMRSKTASSHRSACLTCATLGSEAIRALVGPRASTTGTSDASACARGSGASRSATSSSTESMTSSWSSARLASTIASSVPSSRRATVTRPQRAREWLCAPRRAARAAERPAGGVARGRPPRPRTPRTPGTRGRPRST